MERPSKTVYTCPVLGRERRIGPYEKDSPLAHWERWLVRFSRNKDLDVRPDEFGETCEAGLGGQPV